METKYLADDASKWNYEVAPANTKVSLLNIGKVQSVGIWTGNYGAAFIAWARLIKRNKDIEAVLEFFQFRYTWEQVRDAHLHELPNGLLKLCSSVISCDSNPLNQAEE